ncbi:MAG: 2,4-dihydroxyhept-2-ene-1,7-dioic acid aldolase [Gemmatimonadetes bacterium]|nr:2,4-dihydroxyhept-2-ene-1,7-dioic acid aldolase [Gemmatimonadota bacterium]
MRPFRSRLRAGERLCGTLLSIHAPEVADLLAGAGFDWLFLDAEHGAIDPRGVLDLLYAVADRTPCLVRVPALEEDWIKRVLDAGADGIIVPQVGSAAQAEAAVRFAHHPPRGTRGLGTSRANRYGLDLPAYLREVSERVTVVVQAETSQAVAEIESIVRVPGVDAVFVGPFDLSASLGRPGEVTHPEVEGAIRRVREAAAAAGLPAGIFALGPAGLARWAAEGFTLLAAGVDAALLGAAAADLLGGLRRLPGPGSA